MSGKRRNQNNAACVKCFRIKGGLFLPKAFRREEMWDKILLNPAAGGVLVVLILWEVDPVPPSFSWRFGITLGGLRERKITGFSCLERDQDVEQWQECFFSGSWTRCGCASPHVHPAGLWAQRCPTRWFLEVQNAPGSDSQLIFELSQLRWRREFLLLCSGCTQPSSSCALPQMKSSGVLL